MRKPNPLIDNTVRCKVFVKGTKLDVDIQKNICEESRVQDVVLKMYPNAERIEVTEKNANGIKGTHQVVTWDRKWESWLAIGQRVEVNWKDGYENFTGYHSKDGKKGRFYVGKSTGWMPIYLQIPRRDSMGGIAIYHDCIKTIKALEGVCR